ncbi:MAG TPA: hypothetical protein VIE17_08450 [Methylophilaceae bacterium]|jgi:hypothetical protein
MAKNKILELARRKARSDRLVAFLILFTLLFAGLYFTYQYQMSQKHGHTYGRVISKMLADDKSNAYLCKIHLENGKEVSATCYRDIIEGSRVNLVEVEPHGSVIMYQVENP